MRSQGARTAATASAQGAAVPGEADAEKGGNAREDELVAPGGEVLDRGQDPVARPALVRGDAGERHPAGDRARLAGDEVHVARQRLAVLGRDPLGRVVGVAAAERPADVVEDQQRQVVSPGARSAISRSSSLSV